MERKPCIQEECEKYAQDLYEAFEKEFDMEPRPTNLNPCGKCGIPVCGYHSTAMVMFRDDNDIRKKVEYKPAICARCSWLEDNAGNHGRPTGWVATRSTIPW